MVNVRTGGDLVCSTERTRAMQLQAPGLTDSEFGTPNCVSAHAQIGRPLSVARLHRPEELSDIVDEWDLLARQVSPRTPFASPSWVTLWWKHFPHRRHHGLFRDEFYCHVVRDDGGRLAGIAPLMRSNFPGVGPPLLRVVQFFGVDVGLTEIRGVICRQDDEALVVEALQKYFLDRRGEWDLFRWAGLRQPPNCYSGLDSGLESRCAFQQIGELPDFVVDLPKSWEDLWQEMGCKMRKGLRRWYGFLKRDGFAIALRVTEHVDGVAAAMMRFLALQAARAKAADMTVYHPDKFVEPHERAFLSDYLHGAAGRGELRIFELEIGSAVVASRIGFFSGSDLYLYYAGYDPAWKDYSAMTVLMVEMFKWAFAHGVERVNLSTGLDRSKTRWRPRQVLFRNALQVSPTWRARAALTVFKAYGAATRIGGSAAERASFQPPADPADEPQEPSASQERTPHRARFKPGWLI